GAEGVGAWPQVGDGPQELEGMPFLLQGIRFGIGPAVDGNALSMDLRRLPLGGRGTDLADHADAGAGVELLDLRFVVRQLAVRYDLDIAEAGPVVELQKAEAALGVPPRAQPALQQSLLTDSPNLPRLGDCHFFHPIAACMHLSGRRRRFRYWLQCYGYV